MKVKLAAILTAIILAVSAMSVGVFAASGSCTLEQTSYADKDGTFTVELKLSSNPGIRTLSCNIRFDYNDLSFVKVEDAGLLSGFYYTKVGASVVQLTWTGSRKDITDDGKLATLTFKALTDSENGSIVYNSVSATSANGIAAPVDGVTTIVYFGSERNTPSVPDVPAVTEAPEVTTAPTTAETPPPTTTEEPFEEDEFFGEVTEPVTEATEPTTRATRRTEKTTERKTEKRTEPVTEPVTEPTPEPTTAPTTVTTEPTTVTTPETTPATSDSLPISTAPVTEESVTEASEEAFAEYYDEVIDNKSANRGTLLIAIITIALTAVVVAGIEIYKRNR